MKTSSALCYAIYDLLDFTCCNETYIRLYTPGISIWSRNVVHNQSYREEN